MAAIEEAVRYPMEREDWIKTILIGGVLLFLGFLIVPAVIAYGYIITAIRDNLEGKAHPPEFDDWGDLAMKGVYGWIIGIVYMIVPLIIGAVTFGGSVLAAGSGSQAGAMAGIAGMIGGFLITAVLSLLFGYFVVVAIVNFARTGKLGDGFDFETIKRVAFSSEYFTAWLISVGVFIVAGIIGSVLNVIPFLGFLMGSFVFFYAQLVAAPIWADGFAAGFGGPSPDRGSLEEPAV